MESRWLGWVQLVQEVWQGRDWEGRGDVTAPESLEEKVKKWRKYAKILGLRYESSTSSLLPSKESKVHEGGSREIDFRWGRRWWGVAILTVSWELGRKQTTHILFSKKRESFKGRHHNGQLWTLSVAECDICMDFDTNKYPIIFMSRKWHERLSEYIRMN